MYSKKFSVFLAALLVVTSAFAAEPAEGAQPDSSQEAAQVVAADGVATVTDGAATAPAPILKLSEEELIEIVGYLTAQGSGVASLELSKEDVLACADGLKKGLTGELDLMALPREEVEAAFGEAQARAEAVEAGSDELPAIRPESLQKLGAFMVAQSGLAQLGFGAKEADSITKGFIAGASDAEPDPSLEAKMPAFQEFIQVRVQAAQAEMMAAQAEVMAAQAAAQEAAMADFAEVAAEWSDKDNFNVVLETTQGDIEIELMPSIAPLAVANFVGHIESGYYDNLIFHRVIDGFMIQGGDPLGLGTGGESIWGKNFPDEVSEDARFDQVGLLAMANSGPMTNGSQFFITTSKPEWLNDKHTIFGKVVNGYDNVVKIEKAETGEQDKPIEDQKILKAYVVK